MPKCTGMHTVGKLIRITSVVMAFAALAGCSSYEKLPQQNVDGDFKVFMVTTGHGDLTLYLIKAFEMDGKVAMCGGYTSGSNPASNNISRQFADISQVYLDDTKLGNSDFLIMMPIYLREGVESEEVWAELESKRPATNCVKTEIDWRPEFANAKFERKGPNSVKVFD